ncbi:MAG TPA: L,D-transpeptidase [Candidatus Saccharimonadales bacterium]|nr:L,D-transpeptidase [Candidatus Saccharimonadales bacterium]
MASSSLESKTIRPGSLGAYSYYHSARRPDPPARATPFIAPGLHKLLPRKVVITLIAVVALVVAVPLLTSHSRPASKTAASHQAAVQQPAPTPTPVPAAAATSAATTNYCAGNSLDKFVLVSISQRHMWACDGSQTAYDSPVITGMSAHASTVTPTGTYHIYGKQTDTTLTGSDVTGSWSDPVQYWMPFLNNQYGTYGFHDATWRDNSAFGNVSPDSSEASHGCVELPLSTAQWLYGWSTVGTTVTIKS